MIKENTPLQKIESELLLEKCVSLWIKRDDLTHSFISGNKWRKLKYNLEEAKRQGKTTILTFGGAYSNHIYAVAGAGKLFGYKTIGIIRGEETLPLNHTLTFAKECGMQLSYLDRTSYRSKYQAELLSALQEQFGDFYMIPEGGTNEFALRGCDEMVREIELDFDVICMPCGTAGTLAGSIVSLNKNQMALGFSALKGKDFLEEGVVKLIGNQYNNWSINWNYHFGGYAKTKTELFEFIDEFYTQYEIQLDPIYTGKMLFGLFDLIRKDFFKKGSQIVAVHTGGLQGLVSFKK